MGHVNEVSEFLAILLIYTVTAYFLLCNERSEKVVRYLNFYITEHKFTLLHKILGYFVPS